MSSLRASMAALALLWLLFASTEAEAQRITYKTREVASGLNVPWELRPAPDGRLFFTERGGTIKALDPNSGEIKQLLDDREVRIWNEAGMMGFDFHPNFPDSPYIYVAMVCGWPPRYPDFGIYRYTYSGDSLVDRIRLFGPAKALHTHVGSRVVIQGDYLYFSLGEVWEFEIAQDPMSPNGKINRIHLDGNIPFDNPFPGSSAWTTGHRNPQGLAFSPSGTLYSSEHGDVTDDEVNLIEKSRNYGWPLVHGYCDSLVDHPDCEDLNIREPLASFTPTLAASDILFAEHSTFPEWKNSILLATLKDQSLHHLKLNSTGDSIVDHQRYELLDADGEIVGRLRSVCLTDDGRLFLTTSNSPATQFEIRLDKILELTRTGVEPSSVTLLAPVKDSIIDSSLVSLHWSGAFYGAEFEVEVYDTVNFGDSQPIHSAATMDITVDLTGLERGRQFYWRVREKRSAGPWSEVNNFATLAITLPPPPPPDPEPEAPDYQVRGVGRQISLQSLSSALDARIEITDVLGRSRETRNIRGLGRHAEVRLLSLEAGAYFVRVTTSLGTTVHRLQVR